MGWEALSTQECLWVKRGPCRRAWCEQRLAGWRAGGVAKAIRRQHGPRARGCLLAGPPARPRSPAHPRRGHPRRQALLAWLREHGVVQAVLKSNLHQAQYAEQARCRRAGPHGARGRRHGARLRRAQPGVQAGHRPAARPPARPSCRPAGAARAEHAAAARRAGRGCHLLPVAAHRGCVACWGWSGLGLQGRSVGWGLGRQQGAAAVLRQPAEGARCAEPGPHGGRVGWMPDQLPAWQAPARRRPHTAAMRCRALLSHRGRDRL